jgi:hypothetical protein
MSCSESVFVRIRQTVRDGEYEVHAETGNGVLGKIGLSYDQWGESKLETSNASKPAKRLRSFRDVTRHVGARRTSNKEKGKRRGFGRLRSNNLHSVGGNQEHGGDLRGPQSDDSGLPQATQSVFLFPIPD